MRRHTNYRAAVIGTLIFLTAAWAFGGAAAQPGGLPFLQNYTPQTYNANPQNWALAQNSYGLLYVGNTDGLLEYDGRTWRRIVVGNRSRIRSLAIDDDDVIYVGGVGELGHLTPDERGVLRYTSLLDRLGPQDQNVGEVWRTFVVGPWVYFQTDERLVALRRADLGSKTPLRVWRPRTSFHSMFAVGETLLVRQRQIGLQILKGDSLELLPGGEQFAEHGLTELIRYDDRRWLATTRLHGLFLHDGKAFRPFAEAHQAFFAENQVYAAQMLPDGRIALGTLYGGLVLLDHDGNPVQIINKAAGLQDDNVWALKAGRDGALWLALESGVTQVEVVSPFTQFNEAAGLKGGAVTTIRHRGKLYVSTTQGVLVMGADGAFRPVEGLHNTCWALAEAQGALYAANSDGVFRIDGGRAVQVYTGYAYCLHVLKSDASILLVGLEKGVEVLRLRGTTVEALGRLDRVDFEIREMAEAEAGVVWCGSSYNGVVLLTFKPGRPLDPAADFFGTGQGLPAPDNNYVFEVGNQVLIATREGLRAYDPKQKRLALPPNLPPDLNTYAFTGVLALPGGAWLLSGNRNADGNLHTHYGPAGSTEFVCLARPQASGRFKLEYLALPATRSGRVNSSYRDTDGSVWIALSNGLVHYRPAAARPALRPNILLRRVVLDSDSILYNGAALRRAGADSVLVLAHSASLRYDFERLRFLFAAPDAGDPVYYQHRLDPQDNGWSAWTTDDFNDYSTLAPGSYAFRVRARDARGQLSDEVIYVFNIQPPWYQTWWAYALYVLGALSVLFLGYRYLRYWHEAEKRLLEEKIRIRTDEVVRQAHTLEGLADQLQAYNRSIMVLAAIGREITASLDYEEIFAGLHHHVKTLMDASFFAIHIYDPAREVLVLRFNIENDVRLPEMEIPMDEVNRLAVWCVRNRKEIIIHNYIEEYMNYIETPALIMGEFMHSIIYLPLIIKGRIIGDFTVQSTKLNAYNDEQIEILRTLAAYASVALENAVQFQTISEANIEILAQKVALESAYDEIQRQNEHLGAANHRIEMQNLAITDSIQYAKRIQEAILPTPSELSAALPRHFILYRPREIVSGDFYWLAHTDGVSVIAVVDCTGHGVPGAFMSVLGNSLLDQIVNVKGVTDPAEILHQLNRGVIAVLRQNLTDTEIYDGMDIALCTIDPKARTVCFAGANRPMFWVDDEGLHEMRGNKFAIGGRQRTAAALFVSHTVHYQPGDRFYLTSDGYADQFGGPRRQKFLQKRFMELLLSLKATPFAGQRARLEAAFDDWKGAGRQLDDVLVVGVEFI